MLTAEQVKDLFARVSKEAPGRWPAAVQTLIVGLAEENQILKAKLQRLAEGTFALAKEIRGDAPAPVQAAGRPSPSVTVPETSTVNASGEPRSPEEMELERQMDEAIAASNAENGGASTSVPQGRVPASGARRPVRRSAPPANGGNLNPEQKQQLVEQQMDQAIGAMDAK